MNERQRREMRVRQAIRNFTRGGGNLSNLVKGNVTVEYEGGIVSIEDSCNGKRYLEIEGLHVIYSPLNSSNSPKKVPSKR